MLPVTRKPDHTFFVPSGPNNYIEIFGPPDNFNFAEIFGPPRTKISDRLEIFDPPTVLHQISMKGIIYFT